ncbi:MAG: MmgE/PrpD family protein [Haloferacaceae archaeon]
MTDAAPAADLGAFVAALRYDDLPESVVRETERRFVDTVGVAVAGAAEAGGAGELAAETVGALSGSGSGPATLLAGGSAAVHDAALANGVAGHCLDYDDVLTGIHVHPSVVVVPAILAVGERDGATGREAVAAYVAGVEAQRYVAAPATPGHYERGWHATGTFGTVGATAAVASLLGLGPAATTHALNAAVSAAAGVKRNFGSTTKPFHAGHANAAGVVAASLAARGATASADAWTGPNGFYDCFGGADSPDYDALPSLGDGLVLDDPGLDTKKFPCCYFTHSAAEAAATLADEYGIDPADVERVVVRASQAAVDTVPYDRPTSGLEAKFSMPYVVASAIARDRVGPEAFADDALGHEPTETVRDRVVFEADPSLPYGSHASTVTVALADGPSHERHEPAPPGTPETPLSDAELRRKFDACVARALPDDGAADLYRRLDGLRNRPVSDLLAPVRDEG